MKSKLYVAIAALLICIVVTAYFLQFYVFLGYELSDKTEDWAQLGDYFGGILNPVLSFISIVLLIRSLSLQNDANLSLRAELKSSERVEKVRIFESMFFNMIDFQKKTFDCFKVRAKGRVLSGSEAFICLESTIEKIIDVYGVKGASKAKRLIDRIDTEDTFFGVVRAFSAATKMIDSKLSDENGFTYEDRKERYLTLVNFTEFTQVRMILMGVQFLDSVPSKRIGELSEFWRAVEEIGLEKNPY
ncbi:hypothetical protein [Pseudoteredinibacter isoporae]|uniref:hypothetical protein n=1 Tax=Pseudoteredinibacter isoporae TaxID=570281 RepID=UPI003106408B